jgi:hypothetical protein
VTKEGALVDAASLAEGAIVDAASLVEGTRVDTASLVVLKLFPSRLSWSFIS